LPAFLFSRKTWSSAVSEPARAIAGDFVGRNLMTGLWKISHSSMTGYLYWSRMWGLLETENVRAFVTTGDSGWLKSKMPLAIPYWSSDWLTDLLRQPKILSIMPADARPALKLEMDETGSVGFFARRVSAKKPRPAFHGNLGRRDDRTRIFPPTILSACLC